MTDRTLEEIEAQYNEFREYLDEMDSGMECAGLGMFVRLLAIAQEQRAEIARLKDNASTAAFDKICDQLGEANRENEEQRVELEKWRAFGRGVSALIYSSEHGNTFDFFALNELEDEHCEIIDAAKGIGTKR